MGLAPMEKVLTGVSPGLRSEMAMLLLFSDTGTPSTLPFDGLRDVRWIPLVFLSLTYGSVTIYTAAVAAVLINQWKIF